MGSSSLTRDGSFAPCIGRVEVLATGPPGKSLELCGYHKAAKCLEEEVPFLICLCQDNQRLRLGRAGLLIAEPIIPDIQHVV